MDDKTIDFMLECARKSDIHHARKRMEERGEIIPDKWESTFYKENIKGLRQFFKAGLHWRMEKKDTANDTDWFDRMNDKGWKPCMDWHRKQCGDVFNFDNYDKWSEEGYAEYTLNKHDEVVVSVSERDEYDGGPPPPPRSPSDIWNEELLTSMWD